MVTELRCGTEMVWAISAHRLRAILNREIAAIAPESIKPAEQMAKDDRRVEHRAGTIGCPGWLTLQGPEHELAAVFGHLDRTARAARKAGAPETLDQLRFDLAVGAMTDGAFGLTVSRPDRDPGGSTASEATGSDPTGSGARRRIVLPRPRRTIQVDVVVAASTLLGLDDRPAVLRTPSGDVPMSAELVRELAHDDNATWRRILCDPATGSATDVSGGYQPGRRVAEFCAVRDGHTSRFPTSGARHLELDHVRAYDHAQPSNGGRTTAANLSSVGKRDHQAKTDRLLAVSGNANEVLTYRTRAGHSYFSRPHQYLDPDDDPDGAPPY
jgi:hypothetical protein